jgi:hypothetical protein
VSEHTTMIGASHIAPAHSDADSAASLPVTAASFHFALPLRKP